MAPRGRAATAGAMSLALAAFVHCASDYAEEAPGAADAGHDASPSPTIDADTIFEASTDAPTDTDAGAPAAEGNFLRSLLLGPNFATPHVAVDARGDVIVAFSFYERPLKLGDFDLVPVELDVGIAKIAAGTSEIIWATTVSGAGNEALTSLTVDDAGDVYVTGRFDSPTATLASLTAAGTGGSTHYAAKIIGATGAPAWLRPVLTANADGGTGATLQSVALRSTPRGMTFLATFRGELSYGPVVASLPDRSGALFGTLDPASGDLKTSQTIASTKPSTVSSEQVVVRDVEIDRAGNVYIVGNMSASQLTIGDVPIPLTQSNAQASGFAIKLSPSMGAPTLWHRIFDDGAMYSVTNVEHVRVDDSRDAVYFAGTFGTATNLGFGQILSAPGPASQDFFALQFATNDGTPKWQKPIGSTGLDAVGGIALDPWGRLVLTAALRNVTSLVIDGNALPSGNLLLVAKLSPEDGKALSVTARASMSVSTSGPSIAPNGNTVAAGLFTGTITLESPKTDPGGFVAELSP